MIQGLDYFREYFQKYQKNYVLIGGVACYLAMDEQGLDFRATKDLDIVLCAEAINKDFVKKFWNFIAEGEYEHKEKNTGKQQFYRFNNPKSKNFPEMLELFSRKPDQLKYKGEGHLTPIPIDDDISSLSAILLNDDYYQCIHESKMIINNLPILEPSFILPFKARAWLDLTERKNNGDKIDSKKIKKHRNDFFKIFQLLSPTETIKVPGSIKLDLNKFIKAMPQQAGLDIKNFGIQQLSLVEVLEKISLMYELTF